VVDHDGRLVDLDRTVTPPDLDPATAASTAVRRLLSADTEPTTLDDAPDQVSAQDRCWLTAQDSTRTDTVQDVEDLEAADTHTEPADQDDTGPTDAESSWLESVTDRTEAYADQDADLDAARARHHAARAPGQHDPQARQTRPSWTTRGLRQALQQMRLDQVSQTDLRTDAYAIPKRLKRYLVLRDLCCTFPGCARPAAQCEGDHITPWPRGSTSEPNLASECKHHHLAKHGYFTVTRLPDGTMRWTTPTGAFYDRHPRPLLRGW
jgi:hypothetical protein